MVFDRPIAGDVRAYKWKYEWDEYTKDSYGGEVGIGFPIRIIDRYTRGWIKYSFEDANITDISPSASWLIKEMDGHNVTSAMDFTLSRNSTDRPWNTTKGSINSVSLNMPAACSAETTISTNTSARSSWYFPLPPFDGIYASREGPAS